jgi:transposase
MAMTTAITKTAGCDLGDKYSHVCVLDSAGEVELRARLSTTQPGFRKWFSPLVGCRVVVEVGTHSRWVQKLLEELGHEVIVANARQVRLIYQDKRKSDRLDAEKLARLARADPRLLSPIRHRGEHSQSQLSVLRARDQLVKARTELINHVRGVSKSFGVRIKKCDSPTFSRRTRETTMPVGLVRALEPLLKSVEALSKQIKAYESMLAQMAQTCREVQPLLAIHGVGELTAMAYVLTLEDPTRFPTSRDVGPFLGLVPRQRQTGNTDPELRITRAGDAFVRRLLVNCAQRMLGPFGQDSDLRRHGLRLMGRGGKTAKKKAVIAVARKLAVLMHRLWVTGEVYEPLRKTMPETAT